MTLGCAAVLLTAVTGAAALRSVPVRRGRGTAMMTKIVTESTLSVARTTASLADTGVTAARKHIHMSLLSASVAMCR